MTQKGVAKIILVIVVFVLAVVVGYFTIFRKGSGPVVSTKIVTLISPENGAIYGRGEDIRITGKTKPSYYVQVYANYSAKDLECLTSSSFSNGGAGRADTNGEFDFPIAYQGYRSGQNNLVVAVLKDPYVRTCFPADNVSNIIAYTYTGDKTAEWKAYINDKFGFELKYPADLKLTEGGGTMSVHVTLKRPNLFELTFFAGIEERGGPGEGYTNVIWQKKINLDGLEVSEYLATPERGGNDAFLSIGARQNGTTRFDQFWAFFDLRKEKEVVPQVEAIAKTLKYTQPLTSEKESIYGLFKSIVNWKTEDPATNIQISRCTDGTKHNPAYKVYEMSFGPGSPDILPSPSIQSVQSSVRAVLVQNGWRKCTPDDDSQGDYYSNIGPWFQETYIKNGKLLQLNTNLSMGVGYSIVIQFEYSN